MQGPNLGAQRRNLLHQVALDLPFLDFNQHGSHGCRDKAEHFQTKKHGQNRKRTGSVRAGNNVAVAHCGCGGKRQLQAVCQCHSPKFNDPKPRATQPHDQNAEQQ